ncbi:MAG: F0F1 ATP synthase subunit B [Candidatus Saccharimonadales bacterium]
MLTTLTTFADSSSGLGALGFDGKAFIIQLVTFILAFAVLKKYAFPPIIKVLRERRETIEQGVKLGEQMKKEQAEFEIKKEEILHESRKQADSIISEAQDASKQIIRNSEDKARLKADGIIKEAEERIVFDTQRARKSLEKELVGLIADTTEAIIEEKVDAKKDGAMIEKALKEKQAA